MKIKIVVHQAEEGGFWAEVPAIPGCATQGESMDELMQNLHEAIEGCLSIEVAPPEPGGTERMLELPAGIRPRLRSHGRASRLDPASRQWQSSYLWQGGQHCPAIDPYSWQSGIEKGFVAASGEARRYFR
jgi:predicted RNase H-like HicB family nuclease